MLRRLGATEKHILSVQANLAITYYRLGQIEGALRIRRDVYSGRLKLNGEEHYDTLTAANNYANSLMQLDRCEEAKALLLRTLPVARRVLGESDETTLRMRSTYAAAIVNDTGATLDDLREAVATLEEIERTARRVLGGTHPLTEGFRHNLSRARAALRARETPASSA
jgi:hypothetical protein